MRSSGGSLQAARLARSAHQVRTQRHGAVRNGGAAIATAPILCFVDADMQIHPDTFNAVARAIADPRSVGGATGVTMERWSVGTALTFALILPLLWPTGMDTGVVFCRRDDFVRVGGYDERRHFAEDVHFLWHLITLGWSRGQRLRRLRPVKAIASARKFDRYGDWHYFWMMPRLGLGAFRVRSGDTPAARQYWYNDRESTQPLTRGEPAYDGAHKESLHAPTRRAYHGRSRCRLLRSPRIRR